MVGNGQEIPDERNAEVALQAIVNYIIFSKPYISLAGFGDDDTWDPEDDELRKAILARFVKEMT
jgi:hypothetical protein